MDLDRILRAGPAWREGISEFHREGSAVAERSLRLFVAITLPAEVRLALARASEEIAALAPRARRTPVSNLHLTLRFLGNTPAEEVDGLLARLAAGAASAPRYEAEVAGAGTFGPLRHPRVLWAGLARGNEETCRVASCVASALGLAQEDRFVPHLTLARARTPRGDRDLATAREALASLAGGTFEVQALALVRSQPVAGASRYEIVREAPLLA